MTSTIKLVKFERDCGHNTAVKAGQRNTFTGKTGRLIYDYNVVIGGEHRAILSRNATGVGYAVCDADHRPIKTDWRYAHQIGSKVKFEAEVSQLLEQGMIPTLAQMAERRAAEAASVAQQEAEAAEAMRIHVIQAAGVELYDALKETERHLDALGVYRNDPLRLIVRKALAKAEGALDPKLRKTHEAAQ